MKKYLTPLLILAMLALARPAWALQSPVAQATASATSGSTSFSAISVTTGSLLVLQCGYSHLNATSGASDNVNGNWTEVPGFPNEEDSRNNWTDMWYFANAASGSTTVTIANSRAQAATCNLTVWTGMATSETLDQAVTNTSTIATTTAQTGLIVSTTADDLLVGVCQPNTETAGTSLAQYGTGGGTPIALTSSGSGVTSAYQDLSATGIGSYGLQWTTGSAYFACGAAAFRESGATPTPTPSATATATTTPTATPTATPTPAVWTLQSNSNSNGYKWVSPTGANVCKSAAVDVAGTTDLNSSAFASKYGSSKAAWAASAGARLASWGFNTVGQYSDDYAWVSQFPSGGIPYVSNVNAVAIYGGPPAFVSDLSIYPAGMVCGSSFYVPTTKVPDEFAPAITAAYENVDTYFQTSIFANFSNFNANTRMIMLDDGDNPFAFNNVAHENFAYIIAAQTPSQALPTAGNWAANTNYPTSGDVGIIIDSNGNFESTTSSCTSAGTAPTWPALGTINTITADDTCKWRSLGNASDHTLYAKMALKTYLTTEYGTVAALNTAWGTSYTTLDTSDAGGDAGIKAGTYSSYGTGTGLLDEDGTDILSAAAKSSCGLIIQGGTGTWAANSTIQTDLNNFMATFAVQYVTAVLTAAQSQWPTHAPFLVPLYTAPDYVLDAVGSLLGNASYISGNVSNILWTAPAPFESTTTAIEDAQRISTDLNGAPMIVADYAVAQPDSFYAANTCADVAPLPCYTTQPLRGAGMVDFWENTLHDVSNGLYSVVGLAHWSLYDEYGTTNSGLETTYDNPYDQSAEKNASLGSCATSHAYTAPAICLDSNSNYEALSNQVASCTSGGSAPSWPTSAVANLGTLTHDGTCYWADEGQPTPVPEATPIPGTATYSTGYGDAISPVQAFLSNPTANLCDPAATPTPTPTATPTPSPPCGFGSGDFWGCGGGR